MQPVADDHGRIVFLPPLCYQRYMFVASYIEIHRLQSLMDVGCNNGGLLRYLLTPSRREHSLRSVTGLDASLQCLNVAKTMLPGPLDGVQLLHPCAVRLVRGDLCCGALHDNVIGNIEAELLTCVEVIEHISKSQLATFSAALFGVLTSRLNTQRIILTTPNRDLNCNFCRSGQVVPQLRHADHKFEFTVAQFEAYCEWVARSFPRWSRYSIHFIGNEGYTQCAVFEATLDACSSVSLDLSPVLDLNELFDGDVKDVETCDSFYGASQDAALPWEIVESKEMPWCSLFDRVRRASMAGLESALSRKPVSYDSVSDYTFWSMADVAKASWRLCEELSCSPAAVVGALKKLHALISLRPCAPPQRRCFLPCGTAVCLCRGWQCVVLPVTEKLLAQFSDLGQDDSSNAYEILFSKDLNLLNEFVFVACVGRCWRRRCQATLAQLTDDSKDTVWVVVSR